MISACEVQMTLTHEASSTKHVTAGKAMCINTCVKIAGWQQIGTVPCHSNTFHVYNFTPDILVQSRVAMHIEDTCYTVPLIKLHE